MDFNYIEALVTKCKNNDEDAKEKLSEEFRPLIYNISKRTFIDGYNAHDIIQECYQSLFKSVSMYNLEKHRFVAYATNAIKNNMNDLIKRIKTRRSKEYAYIKNMCYSTAILKKKTILMKILNNISLYY